MYELLHIMFMLPTVLFTVPLGIVVLYWLMAIVGAVDLEMFDAMDGAIEGALDGAVDGALDAAVDGAVDGALDGAADGALDGPEMELEGGVGASGGLLLMLASILRLGRVPATIPLSLFVVWAWATSMLLAFVAQSYGVPLVLVGSVLVVAVSTVFGLGLANVTVRPIEPLFHFEHGRRRDSLIGDECLITTGSVTDTFGQADVAIGGDHLLVQVRCRSANGLGRGSRALIVSWDAEADAFVVEPFAPKGLLGVEGR